METSSKAQISPLIERDETMMSSASGRTNEHAGRGVARREKTSGAAMKMASRVPERGDVERIPDRPPQLVHVGSSAAATCARRCRPLGAARRSRKAQIVSLVISLPAGDRRCDQQQPAEPERELAGGRASGGPARVPSTAETGITAPAADMAGAIFRRQHDGDDDHDDGRGDIVLVAV